MLMLICCIQAKFVSSAANDSVLNALISFLLSHAVRLKLCSHFTLPNLLELAIVQFISFAANDVNEPFENIAA